MVDWYDLGSRWRSLRAEHPHGEIEPLLSKFAEEESLAPNTVRRCASAVEVVERLLSAGLLRDRRQVTSLPLKTLGVLQRLERYGLDILKPALDHILLHPELTGSEILDLEATIRNATSSGKALNNHLYRLRGGMFKRSILANVESEARTLGLSLIQTSLVGLFSPIYVDAVVLQPFSAAVSALKILPQAPPDQSELFRQSSVVFNALAAARVFSSVTLLIQDGKDALYLERRMSRFGSSGVHLLTWAGHIAEVVRSIASDRVADLAEQFADQLNVFRNLPQDGRARRLEVRRREQHFNSTASRVEARESQEPG